MQRKKFDDVFKTLASVFKILAHADRIRILALILNEEKDVSLLAKTLDISQSSVSQHLKLLKLNNLVTERREGKHVYYKSDSEIVRTLIMNAIELHSQDLSREHKTASLYKEIKSILKAS